MSLRDKLPPEVLAAARQRYAITRAAEVIFTEVPGLSLQDRLRAARALDAAGLLASPERDAEVRVDERAKVLAGFEVEEAGEVGPCVNPDHATAHAAPGAAWSVPTCQHDVEVTRCRLVGPWEPIDNS